MASETGSGLWSDLLIYASCAICKDPMMKKKTPQFMSLRGGYSLRGLPRGLGGLWLAAGAAAPRTRPGKANVDLSCWKFRAVAHWCQWARFELSPIPGLNTLQGSSAL